MSKMNNSTLLFNLSAEEIICQFKELGKQIQELKQHLEPKQPNEYLTRTQVAKMLHKDITTVHNWTKKGKLKKYGIGNCVYYKKDEVEAALIKL
jgi:hypothetical protein